MSRVAMLDVFVTLFGVAAVYFLIVDRDTRRDSAGPPTHRETVAGRRGGHGRRGNRSEVVRDPRASWCPGADGDLGNH